MSPDPIRSVRRFNRLVTQRAGALEDRFLGRDRPLGESRLLWEIGLEGAGLRDLRSALGLDSGYLSRLVQSLEGRGLVRLEPDPDDQRVRRAFLTPDGVEEWGEIDRRSDDAAAVLLSSLSAEQRMRLVQAMDEVHRLLSLAALHIGPVSATSPEAQWCLARYFEELEQRFEGGFDPGESTVADPREFDPPRGVFLVGTIDGRPVACGAIKLLPGHVGYIKRMWVDGTVRGLGLGRRLLGALESAARDAGCQVVQLETNRVLSEAIRLYRSEGYREVPPFNDERYAHHWFEKALSDA